MVGDTPEGPPLQRAVEQLQQLGLKQYEARCFVALTDHDSATAREISDRVDVPRTRVYEAVRVLEKEGMVEVQHGSPQRFRAIPVEEALALLRERYESRLASLEAAIEDLEADADDAAADEPMEQEVWALSEATAIETRTRELVGEAETGVRLILGSEAVLTESLLEALEAASGRGVRVLVAGVTPELTEQLAASLDGPTVFESELEWLQATDGSDGGDVGRLLLVDDDTILASTVSTHGDERTERAVYGSGFGNSIVVVLNRLLTTGLDVE